MYKIHLRKKRLEPYFRNMYVLNLLKEQQHLAKIRTPKRLEIPNRGVTNLRERKLKKQLTKTPRKQNKKYAKNVHVSFPMSRLEFFDVIGLFVKSRASRVNTKIIQREERKRKIEI